MKFLPTLGYDLKIACAKFQENWFIIDGEIDKFLQNFKKNSTDKKKNTVQALKYPSAHAVTLYMPGFKAIN